MDEMREAIAACCKKLRLSANLADKAMEISAESNQEYLYRLLQDEIEHRYKSRITKLIKLYP